MGGRCWRVDRQSAHRRRLQAWNGSVRAAISVQRGVVRALPRHRGDVLRSPDAGCRRLQLADVRCDPRPRRPHARALDRGVAAHRRPSAAHSRHSPSRRRLLRRRLDAVGRIRVLRRLRQESRRTASSRHQPHRKSTDRTITRRYPAFDRKISVVIVIIGVIWLSFKPVLAHASCVSSTLLASVKSVKVTSSKLF